MSKVAYRNSNDFNPQLKVPDLDTWYAAYEDMWEMIHAGYTQAQVIDEISKQWEDGEVGKFLQWVRFYEGEDDKRYSSAEILSGFIKVAFSRPGLEMRTEDVKKQVMTYKKKMFSRLQSLRKLIEDATIDALPPGMSFDADQISNSLQLIRQLSDLIRQIKVEDNSPQAISAAVSTIEDSFYKLASILNRDSYAMIKSATSDKGEILQLLTDAHKNFVEKPSVRSLAMAFAKDSLGQFPDIGQALAKMIDAHNYVTPRIEEVMSSISVQLSVGDRDAPRPKEDGPPEPKQEDAGVDVPDEAVSAPQEIEIQMPDDVPRLRDR